jgi:dCTP deaminase
LIEPGWHGHLTIEVGNLNPCQVEVYALEGIAQVEFEWLAGRPERTYADKYGKYIGQLTPTPAKVK